MKLSLVLQAFCLLTTVFLCGGETNTTVTPETNATETSTLPSIATTDVSNMTTDDASNTTTIPTIIPEITESVPATEIVKESNSGLSPGAIAGITIGSIAGVGAIGGGIFGILKYTGKI